MVESVNNSQMKDSSELLLKLLAHLRSAREMHEWDLADFCLERCAAPIERIARMASSKNAETEVAATERRQNTIADSAGMSSLDGDNFAAIASFDDLFIPTDSLDYPWEILWDNMEGP